jgi:cation transport ATPase
VKFPSLRDAPYLQVLNIRLSNYISIKKSSVHSHTMPQETPETDRCACEKESDTIQKFFHRPYFLSITIGIPFCVFKLLFGITAIRIGDQNNLFLTLLGWLVIFWATIDLIMNIGRSALAQIGRIFHKPLVFLAIDTLLTFGIICAMLWSGWITKLTPFELILWYSATTLNLISLSLVSIYNEIKIV